MRLSPAAGWIAACGIVTVLSLIQAAVSSAAPPAPVTQAQPPIRADLVIYYLADVRGNVKPCT